MRVATFNVNSIRSRLPVLTAWLTKYSPDILCLQETKAQDPDFPVEALEAVGYTAAFRGEKSYNGVAILSRKPLKNVCYGFNDGGPADEARLISGQIGPVHVVNTYVPQGREITHEMYQYKLNWFGRLRDYFRRFGPDELVVWTGDLNVAYEPRDVHSPDDYAEHVCYHHQVREELGKCLAAGFVDVFRHYHPEGGQYTFFDYRVPNGVKRGLGWRIDYVLANEKLAAKAQDSFIDLQPRLGEKASDHTPLIADFAVDL